MSNLLKRRQMMLVEKPVFYNNLYFDGAAYIDTDIIPTGQNTFRVSIGYESQKSAQHVYDFLTTNGRVRLSYGSNTTSTTRKVNIWYDGSGSGSLKSVDVAFSVDYYSTILTPYRFFYYSEKTEFSGGGNGVGTGPLVIGALSSHSGNFFTGRISQFRIYGPDAKDITVGSQLNNYTPVITLRPCTYKGEAGLWYVEGNKFYGNTAGSGTLTASN